MKRYQLNRRKVIKRAGAVGIGGIFASTGVAGRGPPSNSNGRGPPSGEEPDTVKWEGQGGEHADQSHCDEAHWRWVLTPGGSNHIDVENDEYPRLVVKFTDNTEAEAYGFRPGYGTRGAVHFDIYHSGAEVKEATAYLEGGGSDRSILTISDGRCVPDEFLPYWQVDLIYGEPIEDYTVDGGTSYGEQQRLLQALWYPGDRVEDFVDHNDGQYAHCDVSVVEDITFDEETATATATIRIGNPGADCGPDDFRLVSYDSEYPHWGQVDDPWDGGEGQVLHGVSDGWDPVEDDTYRYTVDVPH